MYGISRRVGWALCNAGWLIGVNNATQMTLLKTIQGGGSTVLPAEYIQRVASLQFTDTAGRNRIGNECWYRC